MNASYDEPPQHNANATPDTARIVAAPPNSTHPLSRAERREWLTANHKRSGWAAFDNIENLIIPKDLAAALEA